MSLGRDKVWCRVNLEPVISSRLVGALGRGASHFQAVNINVQALLSSVRSRFSQEEIDLYLPSIGTQNTISQLVPSVYNLSYYPTACFNDQTSSGNRALPIRQDTIEQEIRDARYLMEMSSMYNIRHLSTIAVHVQRCSIAQPRKKTRTLKVKPENKVRTERVTTFFLSSGSCSSLRSNAHFIH